MLLLQRWCSCMNHVKAQAKFLFFLFLQQQQPVDIPCLETFQRIKTSFGGTSWIQIWQKLAVSQDFSGIDYCTNYWFCHLNISYLKPPVSRVPAAQWLKQWVCQPEGGGNKDFYFSNGYDWHLNISYLKPPVSKVSVPLSWYCCGQGGCGFKSTCRKQKLLSLKGLRNNFFTKLLGLYYSHHPPRVVKIVFAYVSGYFPNCCF